MHYRTLWLSLGALYIALILAASLLRTPDIELPVSHTDKIIHFLMYFILVAWFAQLYKKPHHRTVILIAAVLLGIAIENIQGITDYRSFDNLDIVANTCGAFCAFLLSRTSFDSLLSPIDQWLYRKIKNV